MDGLENNQERGQGTRIYSRMTALGVVRRYKLHYDVWPPSR